MSARDRRNVLRLALAAAIAPALASRRALADPGSGRLIAPPTGEMRFRRVLSRDMARGYRMVVHREFAVAFRSFAGGFMVEGEQVLADVEAPPALSAFAELEAARHENGLFPLALDPFGHILSADHALPPAGEIGRALDEARRQIATQPIPESERAELQQFVRAMAEIGAGLTAHLPHDLFAPDEAPRREERSIALPTGDEGRVVTSFEGARDFGTGLMRVAEREVVTEVEGSRRRSLERWSLAPQ